jgi:hypothetical protein
MDVKVNINLEEEIIITIMITTRIVTVIVTPVRRADNLTAICEPII